MWGTELAIRALTALLIGGCGRSSAATDAATHASGTWASTVPSGEAGAESSIVIPVGGMSCGSCAARIKKHVGDMDGVSSVEVDLEKRHVRVSFAPAKVTSDAIVAKIKELGYEASAPRAGN